MTKYILVENNGLIQVDDLKLIGSSSKRGQNGKIGMFGSGWKYALAWLIRNDASPRIFSGKEEILVDHTYKLHRDNPVRVITFNGEESSLTAEMGPNWQGWMAFREIFSNAIDEGGHRVQMDVDAENIGSVDGVSRVYIPLVDGLKDLLRNFDSYFSFNMKPFYTGEAGKLFVYATEADEHHYRKGIRCYDSSYKQSKISFDFNNISIDEDRLAKHWDLQSAAKSFISECKDVEACKQLIMGCDGDMQPAQLTQTLREAFTEMNADGIQFSTKELSRLLPTKADTVDINSKLLGSLVDEGIIDHPMSKWIKNSRGFVCIPDNIYSELAKNVQYYVSEAVPNCSVTIGAMSDTCRVCVENGTTEFFVSAKTALSYQTVYSDVTDRYEEWDVQDIAKRLAGLCLISMEDDKVFVRLFS